jgi:hypothetical protein
MKSTPVTSGKSAAANDSAQAVIDTRNADLLQELQNYFRRSGLDTDSQKDRALVGKRLGYADQTAVYRFLTEGKWQGDLRKFETRLSSFLANEIRIEGGADLVDDPKAFILPSMFAFLNQVRACGMINIGAGAAGTGKTCACRLYAAKHKSNTIYAHVWAWTAGKTTLARELVTSAGIERRRGENHAAALSRHFRDKQVMFVIDNAQRLTASARNWLADFLDYTGASIALIGNPEISDQWSRVDQHSRRVGLNRNVSIDLFDEDATRNTSKITVSYLLRQHLPEVAENETIRDEAMKLVTQPKSGSCGSFVQHARLTRLMMAGGITDPVKAFKSAATQLLKAAA